MEKVEVNITICPCVTNAIIMWAGGRRASARSKLVGIGIFNVRDGSRLPMF